MVGEGGSARDRSWPDEVAEPVAEMVARVRARHGELVSTVLGAVRRCPGYRELDGDELLKVGAGVAMSVDRLILLFGAGRHLTAADLTLMRPLGAQRARQGVPLTGVLAAVSAGIAAAWQFVADDAAALDRDEDHVGVLDVVEPWFSDALTAASDAIARGYLDEPASGTRSPPRDALFADLLVGIDATPTPGLERPARPPAGDLSAQHGLVVFAAPRVMPVSVAVLAHARDDRVGLMPGALGGARHLDPVPHVVTITCVQPTGWGAHHSRAQAAHLRRSCVTAATQKRSRGTASS